MHIKVFIYIQQHIPKQHYMRKLKLKNFNVIYGLIKYLIGGYHFTENT